MAASRRGFLLGVAATACLGCTNDVDDDADAEPGRRPGDGDGDGSSTTTVSTISVDEPGSVGFGGSVEIGSLDDVLARIDQADGFLYVPEARAWVVRYPESSLDAARAAYDDETFAGLELGMLALFQMCPHLGCRVPQCTSSQRFECPCHASVFNRAGEYEDGPAPRGMDRFVLRVEDDAVLIDTDHALAGLAIGVQTVDGEVAGPSCIG